MVRPYEAAQRVLTGQACWDGRQCGLSSKQKEILRNLYSHTPEGSEMRTSRRLGGVGVHGWGGFCLLDDKAVSLVCPVYSSPHTLGCLHQKHCAGQAPW